MFNKTITTLILSVSLINNCYSQDDWLNEISNSVGSTESLDITKAVKVIENKVKETEKYIAVLEDKIVAQDKDGFWQYLGRSGYKAELASVNSQKNYYLKILTFLNDLKDNKKERERFVKNLKLLNISNQELSQLQKDHDNAITISERIAVNAKIVAKQTEIAGRRAMIKSSFLF